MAEVTWLHVRIETPLDGLDSAAGFWAAAAGTTVEPGPTGVNVRDLRILLRRG